MGSTVSGRRLVHSFSSTELCTVGRDMTNDRQSKPGPGIRKNGTPYFFNTTDFQTISSLLQTALESDDGLSAVLGRVSNTLAATLYLKGQRLVMPKRDITGDQLMSAFDDVAEVSGDSVAKVVFDYVCSVNLEIRANDLATIKQDINNYVRIPLDSRPRSIVRQNLVDKVVSSLRFARIF